MQIAIAYARTDRQAWLELDLPEGLTVAEAIARSGILEEFPEIDLEVNKVGIFSRPVKLDQPISEGDRIEIYRPLIADPKQVRERNAPAKPAPKKAKATDA
ncbi:MAG: RnfH family protein [Hyphomicrobiales bacterium]|nr:MAG: RnfH family protein [Hyphomicrobiales bacterium]